MLDTVQRLRLHGGGAGADTVARRHRAEAVLSAGLPPPRGLPAGALLCVRRLHLALPAGALAGVARQAAPRLARELDEAWSQAVRPGLQTPGDAVPALWFADEVELLVFLARRAQAGDTAAWWWPALAGVGQGTWARVAAVWRQHATAVPAALEVLGDGARPLLAALGEAASRDIATSVAAAFGVRGGWPVAAWREGASISAGLTSERSGTTHGPEPGHAPVRARQSAPAAARGAARGALAAASPPAIPGLVLDTASRAAPTEAEALLALAGWLQHEPGAASRPDALERLQQWARAGRDAHGPPHPPPRAAAAAGWVPGAAAEPTASQPVSRAAARPDAAAPLPRCETEHAPASRRSVFTPLAGLFFCLPLLQQWCPATPAETRLARRELAVLWPALQAEAAKALARPTRGALAWLVRRPGRVQFGPVRIDLHFELATHPLAIRAAGLDRDPGWVPAAGRHVHFHFGLEAPSP
jgi:hypothetical protein